MIYHWKGLDLEITDSEYHHYPTPSGGTIPSQTLNLKHVEFIKVSEKPTYNISLETS